MIEMVYHLQLNAALGAELKFLGATLDAHGVDSWFGAVFVMLTGLGLFEVARRQFVRQWGEIQEYIEKEIKRRETLHDGRSTYALELNDLRKSFGKTEIIRGANLQVHPGERVAVIGPNGAGKSTLFNLISGRFAPTSGEVLLNGHRIDGKQAVRDQPAGPVAQLPDHQHLPQAAVFENLRCGVLWSLGYKLHLPAVPGRPGRRQRARRAADGDDPAAQEARRAGR